MELLISGVSVKLSADEIISALLSDEGKGLWELKRKLDEIESQITEVEFEESEPLISDKDIERIMGMPDIIPMRELNDKEIYGALQGDVILPTFPKKSPTVKKKRRRRRINPKTGKRYYHRKRKKTKFVETKNHKPIINDEDSPVIIPAKRPPMRDINLNL